MTVKPAVTGSQYIPYRHLRSRLQVVRARRTQRERFASASKPHHHSKPARPGKLQASSAGFGRLTPSKKASRK